MCVRNFCIWGALQALSQMTEEELGAIESRLRNASAQDEK